jgi:hypothetical protein
MVFGYNGVGRLGLSLPGAAAPVLASYPGSYGWAKLFNASLGPEIGWSYVLALLGLVAGVLLWRDGAGGAALRAGFAMWGSWLLIFAVAYSAVGALPHTAYLTTMAPPIAALSGAGTVFAWRWRAHRSWRAWLLPVAVVGELEWTLFLWRSHLSFLPWALGAALVTGVAGLAVAVRGRTGRPTRPRLVSVGLAAGLVGTLLAPTAWAASVLDPRYGGSPWDASAGPAGSYGTTSALDVGDPPPALRHLYQYLQARDGQATYLFAAQSWYMVAPYIVTTGREALPMGGFSGSVPYPRASSLPGLVASGRLRFVMLAAPSAGLAPARAPAAAPGPTAIARWVRAHCDLVPAGRFLGPAGPRGLGLFREFLGPLYRCPSPSPGHPRRRALPSSGSGPPGER